MRVSADPPIAEGQNTSCYAATSRTLLRVRATDPSRLCAAPSDQHSDATLPHAWSELIATASVARNRDTLKQAAARWLRQLGWDRIDACEPMSELGAGISSLLRARVDQASLSVWIWDQRYALDGPVVRDGCVSDSPARLMARLLAERGERVGLLMNPFELRLLLTDPNGTQHYYAALLAPTRATHLGLMPCSHLPFSTWCSPQSKLAVDRILLELRTVRQTLLAQLRRQIQLGVERFLTQSIRLPLNEAALAAMGSPAAAAKLLWHETLLFGFCVLVMTTADAAPSHARGRHPQSRRNSTFPLLEYLTSTAPVDWSEVMHQLLNRFGDAHEPTASITTTLAAILPDSGFPQLRMLRFDAMATRELFASLLLAPQEYAHARGHSEQPRPLPFNALGARDLADVFETMLNLRPGIAVETLHRQRCGKYDVVTAVSASATSNEVVAARATGGSKAPHGRQRHRRARSEQISAGSFYVCAGNDRKSSGAFYTPQPLVEYLVDGTCLPIRRYASAARAPTVAEILATKILDPAMGAGAFLLEAAHRLADVLLGAAAAQCSSNHGPPVASGTDRRDACGSGVAAIPVVGPRLLGCVQRAQAGKKDSADVWQEARALCRIAVVSSCIYGVDRNPLAVAVARLFLWLECHGTDHDATPIAQHIVAGDALIGPRIEQLFTLPHSGEPLAQKGRPELVDYLHRLLSDDPLRALCGAPARPSTRRSASVSTVVATWTGGVMLGSAVGDRRYLELLKRLADGAPPEQCLVVDLALLEQHEAGKSALCFELSFPEVFAWPVGDAHSSGFSVVVGNPPWDAVKANSREILAEFDPGAFDVRTRSDRDALISRLSQSPEVAARLREYSRAFAQRKRAHDRQFHHQKLVIRGDLAGRQLDLFRLFIERSWRLLRNQGRLGLVVPSAFHTAAGAVGVRRLLLETGKLDSYVVFRNAQRLFEISRGFEFGLLLAEKSPTEDYSIQVRFGLELPSDLLRSVDARQQEISKSFILAASPYATIPVVIDDEARSIALATHRTGVTYSSWEAQTGVRLRSTPTSIHRTHESMHFEQVDSSSDPRRSFVSIADILKQGALLHEGSTFHRYDDLWGSAPTYYFAARRVVAVERWRAAIGHYRIAMRAIVGSSAHKGIATLLPPGTLVTNSALVEAAPGGRPSAYALATIAVLNSSVANWLLCGLADLNVNLFALRQLPWPNRVPTEFLAHSALRLCANHQCWEPLWREQLGECWRESTPRFELPALPLGIARTSLLAAIDACVAAAYDLNRGQYAKVLNHFGSDWHGASTGECLRAFDAIVSLGSIEFARRHDPYSDQSLVVAAPQPLLELPHDRSLGARANC